MTFNQTTHKDLRDLFCNAVTKVFGDSEAFLDFLENEKYSTKYDPDDYNVCITDDNLDVHIAMVNSIGILACKEEEHKALCFYSSHDLDHHGIDKELPDFIEKVLW